VVTVVEVVVSTESGSGASHPAFELGGVATRQRATLCGADGDAAGGGVPSSMLAPDSA
jgi:hypothetical protein